MTTIKYFQRYNYETDPDTEMVLYDELQLKEYNVISYKEVIIPRVGEYVFL